LRVPEEFEGRTITVSKPALPCSGNVLHSHLQPVVRQRSRQYLIVAAVGDRDAIVRDDNFSGIPEA
jgi:hypothetical protein